MELKYIGFLWFVQCFFQTLQYANHAKDLKLSDATELPILNAA
jgi:hypothetical protein